MSPLSAVEDLRMWSCSLLSRASTEDPALFLGTFLPGKSRCWMEGTGLNMRGSGSVVSSRSSSCRVGARRTSSRTAGSGRTSSLTAEAEASNSFPVGVGITCCCCCGGGRGSTSLCITYCITGGVTSAVTWSEGRTADSFKPLPSAGGEWLLMIAAASEGCETSSPPATSLVESPSAEFLDSEAAALALIFLRAWLILDATDSAEGTLLIRISLDSASTSVAACKVASLTAAPSDCSSLFTRSLSFTPR
mmetsp:Transcript_16103/g.22009  ORF Transcript_16103/g.22009 Transcript_16103/m.22009 type:complete len:249 (+) Transcript_16103:272-1018(+)